MADEVYLTRAGYKKLSDELEKLRKDRIKISRAIEEARLQGDISENAEYDAAKEAQAHNVYQIAEAENNLGSVVIIEDQDIPSDKIYIGAIVTLKDLKTDEKLKYMMVSPEEASYEENKLSMRSPVGAGLMGHAKGEEIEIDVPAGSLKYKVLKIERPK